MNVQQIIIRGISEQLYFNNFLVIPDFGGFILKKLPAHFSASGGMILPPSKTVSFNVQLKQNDGVLTHWLMSELKCGQDQALSHLKDFAEYCRSVLVNKGRLNIEGIGFFYHDLENNLCFEPSQQSNFLVSSFGLSPVSAKEIEVAEEKKIETVFTDRIITANDQVVTQNENKKEEGIRLRRYRRVAIAAVSGLILFSSVLLLVSNHKISGQLKSAVFGSEKAAVYSTINYPAIDAIDLSENKKDYVSDANGIASIELDNKNITVKVFETESKKENQKSSGHYPAKNFEVVLGCFSIQNNANKLVKKMKKDHHLQAWLSPVKHKGMFVVSAGGFNSKEEAVQKLQSVQYAVPNAWIKKSN